MNFVQIKPPKLHKLGRHEKKLHLYFNILNYAKTKLSKKERKDMIKVHYEQRWLFQTLFRVDPLTGRNAPGVKTIKGSQTSGKELLLNVEEYGLPSMEIIVIQLLKK